LLVDHTKILGTLEFPQRNKFDLILTNPPFTVRGTKVIKEQISGQADLKKAYDHAGIGIESLFMRWIIDALKPNCQAFVIVPTGILARTETSVRDYLLRNCELDAIISLPENTFYNTANQTYIVCFTKKEQPSPTWELGHDVFCYIVREIGETRDTLRFPCKTDLNDLVRQFRTFYADKDYFEPRSLNCKLVDKSMFKPENRWDIEDIFWDENEKIQLGLTEFKTINITHFESELDATVESIKIDLDDLKTGNDDNGDIYYNELTLGDTNYFKLLRGQRITKSQINDNTGDIPVISSSGKGNGYLGHISEKWLDENNHPLFDHPLITVNADGSVGDVFIRRELKYTLNDVVIGIELLDSNLDQNYVMYALKESIATARFKYGAKLYMKRLRKLSIRIPVNEMGDFDVIQQRQEAEKYEKLIEVKYAIKRFADDLENKFIIIGSN